MSSPGTARPPMAGPRRFPGIPRTGVFTPIPNNLTNMFCNSAVALADGRILAIGGHADFGVGLRDADIYDPADQTVDPGGLDELMDAGIRRPPCFPMDACWPCRAPTPAKPASSPFPRSTTRWPTVWTAMPCRQRSPPLLSADVRTAGWPGAGGRSHPQRDWSTSVLDLNTQTWTWSIRCRTTATRPSCTSLAKS